MRKNASKLNIDDSKLSDQLACSDICKLIVENIADMISRHNLDGKYCNISPSCKIILGYEPEELIGVNPYDLFHPEDIKKIERVHKKVLETHDVYISTYRIRRKDGFYVWLETSNITIRDKTTNEAIEIICVSKDITDRKKIEDALIISQVKYRNIFATVKDSLFIFNQDNGAILDVNYATCDLYGYTRSELLKLSINDILAEPRKDLDMIEEFKQFIPLAYHKKKNGTIFPVDINASSFVMNEKNVILASICNITNKIEDKKMLERMVDFSEELLQITSDYIDYKKILENLLEISNAKFGILNLYNVNNKKYVTTALAGVKGLEEITSRLLGYKIIGKEWDDDYDRNEKINGKIITKLSSISELSGKVITPALTKAISIVYRLGEVYLVKIIKDDKIIGDFTLIMSMGKQFKNENLVEIYCRQIGMFITRKQAEKALEEKDRMLHAISEATKILLINSDYNVTIPKGLKLIGVSTGVSGLSYFQNGYDGGHSKLIPRQEFNWYDDLAYNKNNYNKSHKKSLKNLNTFIPHLIKGKTFSVIVNDLCDDNMKKILVQNEILSILVLPIYVKDIFWGFLRFDECKFERKWSEAEISTLQIFVDSMSKAIERKLYEEELEFLSYHDNLTGLFNRRKYGEFSSIIEASGMYPVSVIVGDVNGLKLVNDAFGHICGDNLLKKISDIIRTECGDKAYVARRGGDEFAAILPSYTYQQASDLVQRIKKRCEEETTDELMLNISFGVETKVDDRKTLDYCYHIAEDRMYASKLLEGKSIRNKIIENFRAVMEEKTGETRKHCERIAELSQKIGSEIGLLAFEMENLKLLSLLHDIGKTGIPDHILLKPGKLDGDELSTIKKHCEIGFRIANTLHELLPIADGILSHHERWDGKGYPRGLKGTEISLMARIVTILDAFDAMTNDRPYRKALSFEKAIKEIKLCSGTQFDPYIVDIFINKVLYRENL